MKDTGKQVDGQKNPEAEELFDLIIPPGTPQSVISDVTKKFDVDVVERKERLFFANMDGDERILLAFRGKLGVMREVEPYFYAKVKEFIDRV
ncbi:MAG: hypothetical protein MUF37_08505 [Methanoregulaceae archaeon]|nr:hypothetical protein [Methanoregulaceae archaeon]